VSEQLPNGTSAQNRPFNALHVQLSTIGEIRNQPQEIKETN